jgi:hypothetical protein
MAISWKGNIADTYESNKFNEKDANKQTSDAIKPKIDGKIAVEGFTQFQTKDKSGFNLDEKILDLVKGPGQNKYSANKRYEGGK